MIHLLIADDHAIFRGGLARIVETTTDMVIEAMAGSGTELLERLPDSAATMLLLDLSMPGISGVDLIKSAHALRPELPILVLTMHNEARTAMWALEAGASGYATKDSDPEALIDGIRRVAEGGRYISPGIAESISFLTTDRKASRDILSRREWEILKLLARGLEINTVARDLNISPKTVSTHKMRLMRKLGLSSNIDLVHYVIRRGLVPESATGPALDEAAQ